MCSKYTVPRASSLPGPTPPRLSSKIKLMRLRAINLACLLLLLSSLSAAEGATLRSGEFGLGGHYIASLLAQDRGTKQAEAPLQRNPRDILSLTLAADALQHHRAAWPQRPSAAHSINVQSVTASGL